MLTEEEEIRLLELLKIEAEYEVQRFVSFKQFCENAGYYPPLQKQIDMHDFAMELNGVRMILGSRGYGKTDYAVIMGMAYKIYRDRQSSFLLLTKSKERNAAICEEVSKALVTNGVELVISNTSNVRVRELRGKDHSLSTLTIGSNQMRGRHPKYAIMDDPVNEEDVSEATRKRVRRKYNELHKLTSNILVIGQPVHKLDLYGDIRDLVKTLEMPHGTIPELDHDLAAQRAAGVSEESISASYHLKVISESSTPFENVNMLDEYPHNGTSVMFIDPSFTGGDYCGVTIMQMYFQGMAIYGKAIKRAWYDAAEELVQLVEEFDVAEVCFETNTIGEQPIVTLRDLLRKTGNKTTRVSGKNSLGHKHARIVNAGQFAHLLHIAKTSDTEYIRQVKHYEYKAQYDDCPDSLASCMEWLGLIKGKQNKNGKKG